jgi:hypothetical protein
VDHIVVLGETHLRRILREYARYYNIVRTHRMTDQATLTKQRTGALLAAARERAPHIDWSFFTTHGPAIIGTLPNGKGSVLVMQYGPTSYTLRHNTRMVRRLGQHRGGLRRHCLAW